MVSKASQNPMIPQLTKHTHTMMILSKKNWERPSWSKLDFAMDLRDPNHQPRLVGDYILGPKIGSGSFAVVWKSKHRHSGVEVAVKEIDRIQLSPKVSENLLKEISILSTIDHPNIIRLFDAIEVSISYDPLCSFQASLLRFIDDVFFFFFFLFLLMMFIVVCQCWFFFWGFWFLQTQDRIYLVLEYCDGGDLAAYINKHGKVSEAIARHFMRQLGIYDHPCIYFFWLLNYNQVHIFFLMFRQVGMCITLEMHKVNDFSLCKKVIKFMSLMIRLVGIFESVNF